MERVASGEDLLISGFTQFDQSDAALLLLMQEWSASRSYAERVANLRAGTGPVLAGTGLKLVKDLTVFDDGDADELTGSASLDWFFFGEDEDEVFDLHTIEEEN